MAQVVFDEERCKGCELCVSFCPKKLIVMAECLNSRGFHPARVDPANQAECTGCIACALMCPDLVIEVYR